MKMRWLLGLLVLSFSGCAKDAPVSTPATEDNAPPPLADKQETDTQATTNEVQEESPPAEVKGPGSLPSKVEGFSGPSAVVYDELLDRYLVSNSGPNPWNKEGKGYISAVDRKTGEVKEKWIDGAQQHVELHAPRGMAFNGGILVVTDGAFIRFFDRKTGAHRGSFEVPGASLLDGVAVALDETIYVTDSAWKPDWSPARGSGIYMLNKGLAQPVLISDDLSHPGGLVIKDDVLWVASTKTAQLVAVDRTGKVKETIPVEGFGLRGLAIDSDGDFLISSSRNGTVLKGTPKNGFSAALKLSGASGGIGYDRKRNRLALPVVESGHVEFPEL